jgi:hypothetical protein
MTTKTNDTTQLVERLALIELLDPVFPGELLRRADERLIALGVGLDDHEKAVLAKHNLPTAVALRAKVAKIMADPARQIPGLTQAETDQVRRLGLDPGMALRAVRHIRGAGAGSAFGSPQPLR